ncbi:MAG: FadR family transcriptional regulator [Burkholderiales bacterium]|nr:FadR family transcriptional regulator [Burkholderiales bacterium]
MAVGTSAIKTGPNQDAGATTQASPPTGNAAHALLRGDGSAINPFELTIERLGSSIKMGLFAPGDQLPPERELAALMGVSRLTLRAALRALERAGLVTVRRGRYGGTFITDQVPKLGDKSGLETATNIAPAVLEDWIAQRWVLETGVADLAARNASDAQIRALIELNDQMKRFEHDLSQYRPLDTMFHLGLARATGSAGLETWVAQTHARLSELMRLIPSTRGALSNSTDYHTQILDAIAQRDPVEARRVMALHVDATTSMLRGLLPQGAAKRAAPKRRR